MIAGAEEKPEPIETSNAGNPVEATSEPAEHGGIESELLPQHGLVRSVLLHLFPGAVTAAIYFTCMKTVTQAGHSPLATRLISSVAGLCVVELGILLLAGKRRNGRWSLDGIVLYRKSWPTSRYFKVVPVLVLLCVIVYGIAFRIDILWLRIATTWRAPAHWFAGMNQNVGVGRTAVLVTSVSRLAIDGFALPIVEETYFRGYLLPRISRFGALGVVLNCALFAIYHFWQPFSLPTLFLTSLPIAFATWLSANYRLGMATRIVLGLIGGLLGLMAALHLFR